DSMKAPSWRISSSLKTLGLSGACTLGLAIGIRPVPTWKSMAAAPTPTRDGPAVLPAPVLPSALVPWQVAQLARKSLRPSSTSSPAALEVAASDEADGCRAA